MWEKGEEKKVGKMERVGVIKSRMGSVIFQMLPLEQLMGNLHLAMLWCLEGLLWIQCLEWFKSHLVKGNWNEGGPRSIINGRWKRWCKDLGVLECYWVGSIHLTPILIRLSIQLFLTLRSSLRTFHVEFSYIPRILNYAAHSLAKLSY